MESADRITYHIALLTQHEAHQSRLLEAAATAYIAVTPTESNDVMPLVCGAYVQTM